MKSRVFAVRAVHTNNSTWTNRCRRAQSKRTRRGNRPRRANLRAVFHLKLSTSLITTIKAMAIIAEN